MRSVESRAAPIEAMVQIGPNTWLRFEDPARVVATDAPSGVRSVLAEVERLTRDAGLHAVGFVAYEAGAAFGLAVAAPRTGLPLAWFALFGKSSVSPIDCPPPGEGCSLGPIAPSVDRNRFGKVFDGIKNDLAAGETYQVNYTFRMNGSFEGDPQSLFADLVEVQRGGRAVYLSLGDIAICSASPELFFAIDGLKIEARPMKGTARRGRTVAEDLLMRDELAASAKQQAENVMIVDMMRNDLGRIAQVGSVDVQQLFSVERYPNVWQMTSLVRARTTACLEDIFAAIHPSASVTGAPKVRTMEILARLEDGPRGVYTGAIGHVPPDGNASFNVAIRTAVVDRAAGSVEFGVGSGIVWDSDASAEYDECLLKAAVLGRRPAAFELLETLRWTPGEGFFLLERHLERLAASAGYFDFEYRAGDVRAALADAAEIAGDAPKRIRLLLGRDGRVRVEQMPLARSAEPVNVMLAPGPVDPDDVWLFHKTTKREVYERARLDRPDAEEVLLWNPDRQLTEATTSNLVVALRNERVTPPVRCGLLAGTFRAELLARGEVREGIITVDDLLQQHPEMWLVNSVHEWRAAVLIS